VLAEHLGPRLTFPSSNFDEKSCSWSLQHLRIIRKLKGITMQVRMTPRGLQRISFVDQDDKPAILEQTNSIDYANPTFDEANSSFVLLGRKDAPVKLNMDQVAEVVGYLQTWLEDGRFAAGVESIPATKQSRRAS